MGSATGESARPGRGRAQAADGGMATAVAVVKGGQNPSHLGARTLFLPRQCKHIIEYPLAELFNKRLSIAHSSLTADGWAITHDPFRVEFAGDEYEMDIGFQLLALRHSMAQKLP